MKEKHNIYSYDSRSAWLFCCPAAGWEEERRRGSGLWNERECFQASGRYGPGTGAGIKGESGNGGGRARKQETQGQQEPSEPGAQIPGAVSGLPYQFASKYGIIQSEYPVYELML